MYIKKRKKENRMSNNKNYGASVFQNVSKGNSESISSEKVIPFHSERINLRIFTMHSWIVKIIMVIIIKQ